MKFQKIILSLLAAGAILVGCKEDEVPTIPTLTVGQTELSFEQGGGTATFTVTSNRSWSVSTDADWLAFSPSSGVAADAATTVTVTALTNSASDRTASIKVSTEFDYRTIAVSQPGPKGVDPTQAATGSGTLDDPYNVIAALEKAQSLESYSNGDEQTSANSLTVYTIGKVSSVTIDPSFGNATYYISADGTSANTLEIYRGYYLEGTRFTSTDQLKVGDEVIVYGTIVNFNGKTIEYTTGSKIVSLNGETHAPAIDYTKFDMLTVKEFIDKANTSQYFRLKGKVSRFNATYCSFDLTDDSGTIYVYSVANKDDWKDKISNGGIVELAGQYMYYENNSQHEVVNAQILSFEAGQEEDYENAPSKTVAEFISTADNNTYFKLTGKVSRFNATYCSFDLTDDSGTIYVYSVANKSEWSSKISNGCTVVLAGKYLYYENNSQHEVVEAQILSFQAGEQEDYENAPSKTVAEFIETADENTYFKLTGKVSRFNATYCSFDLTDDSGTIYVYSVANKSEWSSKISNDGTVVLAGKYYYYDKNSQHEVVEAQILSFEGEGGQGGGGETVSGTTITFSDLNIANGSKYNESNTITATDFTVKFGDGNNDGKYYNTGAGMRIYGNGYVQIDSEKTITKIVYTFQNATGTSGNTTYNTYPIDSDNSVNIGTVALNGSTATWTGSATSVKLTRATGAGHWRLQKVEVTFAE